MKKQKPNPHLKLEVKIVNKEVIIEAEVTAMPTESFLEIIGKTVGRTLSHMNDDMFEIAMIELMANAVEQKQIENGK